jgi:hypothetical protein
MFREVSLDRNADCSPAVAGPTQSQLLRSNLNCFGAAKLRPQCLSYKSRFSRMVTLLRSQPERGQAIAGRNQGPRLAVLMGQIGDFVVLVFRHFAPVGLKTCKDTVCSSCRLTSETQIRKEACSVPSVPWLPFPFGPAISAFARSRSRQDVPSDLDRGRHCFRMIHEPSGKPIKYLKGIGIEQGFDA